ncbi:hypothetical protein ACTFIZ_012724 [Dictyostelium cf. discoideum]
MDQTFVQSFIVIQLKMVTYFDNSKLTLLLIKPHLNMWIYQYKRTTSNQNSQFSEIGTIVKQFNTNTIFNNYNVFTFIKDSKTIVIQPPLPTYLTIDSILLQFSTLSNNSIMQKNKIKSKSNQNYKYQISIPFSYGYGNFSVSVALKNGRKLKINSISFNYPKKPIITSILKIKDGNLKINGDGLVDEIVFGTFKTKIENETTGLFSETIECYSLTNQYQNINCQFKMKPIQYILLILQLFLF